MSARGSSARGASPRGFRGRRAFSLVELMIAMIILFFGLLVIGAALPVGMDYSRKTANASIGEDAANYAMDVIVGRIRTSNRILVDNLFRPRNAVPPFAVDPSIVPRFKVRPFAANNIDATPDVGPSVDPYTNPAQESELIIARWFLGKPHTPLWEYNAGLPPGTPPIPSAIPSVLRVYPPILPNTPMTFRNFDPFTRRKITDQVGVDAESVKALGRQVVWTGFYRRASYAPDSDPLLYEVIAVATKRPNDQYRFARQNLGAGESFENPNPLGSYPAGRGNPGADRLAPTPWLIQFTSVPFPDSLGIFTPNPTGNPERLLDSSAVEPANLEFTSSIKVGEKLPPGSVFIPALNDPNNSFPGQPGGPGLIGFVPHAPDSLPIYEVTDRIRDDAAGEYKIIVKNNGTYPWVDPSISPREGFWPVWIIPPAIKTEAGQDQVFERKSPIIGVARRYVRFTEVP